MKLSLSKLASRMLLFAAFLSIVIGAGQSRDGESDIPDISKRINAFSIALLKQQAGAPDPMANLILSPQSIFHGMTMSYIASDGDTRKELAGAFQFPADNPKLLSDMGRLRQQLHAANQRQGIEVSLANAAWLDESHADFRKEYVKEIKSVFKAALHQVEFAQRQRVSREINQWISANTHGKIQAGIDPGAFQSRSQLGIIDEPALVTVNAAFFKADWGSRFDQGSTHKQPFHIAIGTTVETPMMHQRSLQLYAEDDHYKFLELPYRDDTFSMYIILPKAIRNIAGLMQEVNMDRVVGLKQRAFAHEVDVLLPKFEMKSHCAVKDALAEMGVKAAFDSQRADFGKMIIPKREAFRLYISEIFHDAWIEVNEEGTAAAAATSTVHYSFGCAAPQRPKPALFHADHPFLFFIVHNQSRSVLFAGWLSNPTANANREF